MKHIPITLAVVLPLLLPVVARAGDIIANPGLTITAAEVKEAFLGEKQLVGGVKLVPVDNAAAQADFTAKVLQIEVAKYNSLWTKKSFREGLSVPSLKGGDAEVASFVKSTPGAVGYVTAAPAGANVVGKF
jgi:hypothetical protein